MAAFELCESASQNGGSEPDWRKIDEPSGESAEATTSGRDGDVEHRGCPNCIACQLAVEVNVSQYFEQ
jgi:hypothetical protein